MKAAEPNMDEGCRIVHRFNENPSQDFVRLTSCIVSCKFFMIKNLNNLTIKPGISFYAMPMIFTISHPLPPEKISSGNILFNFHAKSMQQRKSRVTGE